MPRSVVPSSHPAAALSATAHLPGASVASVAVVALLLAGCGDTPAASETSDGFLDVPRVELAPDLRIDGYEDDLVPIGAVALARDGRIAFTQYQDGQVLVYSPDGSRLAAVGREGDGPGEFRYTQYVGFAADTLWTWDLRHRRLSWFALEPQPRFLRDAAVSGTNPWLGPDSLGAFRQAQPRAVHADGSVFASVSDPQDPTVFATRGQSVYVRTTPEGDIVYPIAQVTRPRTLVTVSRDLGDGRTTGVGMSLPWVMRSFVVPGGDPEDVVIVRTEVDAEAPNVTIDVTRLERRDTAWTAALRLRAHPITPARADSAIEAVAARISDQNQADWDFRDEFRRQATTPPVVPPVDAVILGPDGSLWLGLGPVPDYPEGTWIVLDPDGTPAMAVSVPGEDREVVQVMRDLVWLAEADSLGVESLVRYRVGG